MAIEHKVEGYPITRLYVFKEPKVLLGKHGHVWVKGFKNVMDLGGIKTWTRGAYFKHPYSEEISLGWKIIETRRVPIQGTFLSADRINKPIAIVESCRKPPHRLPRKKGVLRTKVLGIVWLGKPFIYPEDQKLWRSDQILHMVPNGMHDDLILDPEVTQGNAEWKEK